MVVLGYLHSVVDWLWEQVLGLIERTRGGHRFQRTHDLLIKQEDTSKFTEDWLKKYHSMPHAVPLISFDDHSIVMPRLKGKSLFFARDRMQIHKAIMLMHQHNFAHADLDSGNMLVVDQQLVILDPAAWLIWPGGDPDLIAMARACENNSLWLYQRHKRRFKQRIEQIST